MSKIKASTGPHRKNEKTPHAG